MDSISVGVALMRRFSTLFQQKKKIHVFAICFYFYNFTSSMNDSAVNVVTFNISIGSQKIIFL